MGSTVSKEKLELSGKIAAAVRAIGITYGHKYVSNKRVKFYSVNFGSMPGDRIARLPELYQAARQSVPGMESESIVISHNRSGIASLYCFFPAANTVGVYNQAAYQK